MRIGLFLAAICAHLISVLYPHEVIQWIISILSILIILAVFSKVSRVAFLFGLFFLSTGIILCFYSSVELSSAILFFGSMLNILSLFALIPLIALPVDLGNYAYRVQVMIQKRIKQSSVLYIVTSFMSYVFSSFMGLATLPMMYRSIRPSLEHFKIKEKERFMSRSITHGYSMPIIWTPVAPIVGIVIEMTGVSWSKILPIVIPFSLLGLLLDWILGTVISKRRRREGYAASELNTSVKEETLSSNSIKIMGKNPIHILIAIVIFNALISILETQFHYGFMFLVSVLVLPFGFLWSIVIRHGKQFLKQSKTVLFDHILKMKDQFYIFLCAGFFISVIQNTEAGHIINDWIFFIKEAVGIDLFILMIPLIPLGLAFIGLHPAVGLALAAESLNAQILGISSELLAIAMLTGASTAFLMGPYNATAGIMANLVNKTPYRISNWNFPFTALYMVLIMLLLISLS
jgi:hypothetical protein